MQALILAAGSGQRFGGNIPKPLIRVAGKPIILHLCDQLSQLGCDDIIVVCGYQKALLEKAMRPNIRTVFNPFYEVTETLTSFWFGQSQIHDEFFLIQADAIFQIEILNLIMADPADIVFCFDAQFIDEEEYRIELVEGDVRNLGRAIPTTRAAGLLLPIQKLTRKALSRMKNLSDEAMQSGNFLKDIESTLLELVLSDTCSTSALDVARYKWCEINQPDQFDRARQLFGE